VIWIQNWITQNLINHSKAYSTCSFQRRPTALHPLHLRFSAKLPTSKPSQSRDFSRGYRGLIKLNAARSTKMSSHLRLLAYWASKQGLARDGEWSPMVRQMVRGSSERCRLAGTVQTGVDNWYKVMLHIQTSSLTLTSADEHFCCCSPHTRTRVRKQAGCLVKRLITLR